MKPKQFVFLGSSVLVIVVRKGPVAGLVSTVLATGSLLESANCLVDKLRVLVVEVKEAGVFAKMEAKRHALLKEIELEKLRAEEELEEDLELLADEYELEAADAVDVQMAHEDEPHEIEVEDVATPRNGRRWWNLWLRRGKPPASKGPKLRQVLSVGPGKSATVNAEVFEAVTAAVEPDSAAEDPSPFPAEVGAPIEASPPVVGRARARTVMISSTPTVIDPDDAVHDASGTRDPTPRPPARRKSGWDLVRPRADTTASPAPAESPVSASPLANSTPPPRRGSVSGPVRTPPRSVLGRLGGEGKKGAAESPGLGSRLGRRVNQAIEAVGKTGSPTRDENSRRTLWGTTIDKATRQSAAAEAPAEAPAPAPAPAGERAPLGTRMRRPGQQFLKRMSIAAGMSAPRPPPPPAQGYPAPEQPAGATAPPGPPGPPKKGGLPAVIELVRYSLLTVRELHQLVQIERVQKVLPDLSKKKSPDTKSDAPQPLALPDPNASHARLALDLHGDPAVRTARSLSLGSAADTAGASLVGPVVPLAPQRNSPLAQVNNIAETIRKTVQDLRKTSDALVEVDKKMSARMNRLNDPKWQAQTLKFIVWVALYVLIAVIVFYMFKKFMNYGLPEIVLEAVANELSNLQLSELQGENGSARGLPLEDLILSGVE